MDNAPLSINPGQKARFIARNAQEAAQIIRTKLGPQAQVLSIRQIKEGGLSRFLKSPKLEVIATIRDAPKPASLLATP